MSLDGNQLRRLYPRLVAKMYAVARSLPDAEDAVQDALERALRRGADGSAAPLDSPEAWLLTVATNAHRDRLRRRRHEQPPEGEAGARAGHADDGDALERLARMSPWVQGAMNEPEIARGWKDELLGLLFACCHPALEPGESAALALATVIGLSVSEIAHAFVVAPRSMEQRLTRARQRLRERGDHDGARPDQAHDRVDAVLRTLHLLFNEGYWSTSAEAPIRGELCRLAIGLASSLHQALPDQAEAAGLLALLLLHEARRAARLDGAGGVVPLPAQERARWDHPLIARATALLERTLALGRPGPLQIEAAISAVHCRAGQADATDWTEIAALYALLEALRPTPAVRVNRAYAVARAEGAPAGLALLEPGAAAGLGLEGYPYLHLVRGALLDESGQPDAARAALRRAHQHARNPHERAHIEARLAALGDAAPPPPRGRQ